jgi:hypothetical protein
MLAPIIVVSQMESVFGTFVNTGIIRVFATCQKTKLVSVDGQPVAGGQSLYVRTSTESRPTVLIVFVDVYATHGAQTPAVIVLYSETSLQPVPPVPEVIEAETKVP